MSRRPILLLLLMTVGAGCSSGSTNSSAGSQQPTPSHPATQSPTPLAAEPAAKTQEVVNIEGDERLVTMYRPNLEAGALPPLLVLLHGNGESPGAMADQSGIGQFAAREGVIVALPPARARRWDALQYPDLTPAASPDVAYISGLIDRLLQQEAADPSRVFVAGFSMGGALTDRIACELADQVAAVAIDAGTQWGGACAPSKPVSVLVMHGTADPTFSFEAATEMVDRWRSVMGCAAPAAPQEAIDGGSLERFTCEEGTELAFVTVDGGAHRWFVHPDATALAADFFRAATRP